MTILLSHSFFCQDSLRIVNPKVRVVAVTPLNSKVGNVNGLAFGLGLETTYLFKQETVVNLQKVNGLNVEVNPLGILFWLFYDASKTKNIESIKVNGVNVSLAGYSRGISHNGASVSLYNYGHKMNGAMISLASFDIEKGNGVFLAFLNVSSKEIKGLSFSAFNNADVLKGVQFGLVNNSIDGRGLQLGLVNKSKKLKGLQIGFWNKNGKRTLPLINF